MNSWADLPPIMPVSDSTIHVARPHRSKIRRYTSMRRSNDASRPSSSRSKLYEPSPRIAGGAGSRSSAAARPAPRPDLVPHLRQLPRGSGSVGGVEADFLASHRQHVLLAGRVLQPEQVVDVVPWVSRHSSPGPAPASSSAIASVSISSRRIDAIRCITLQPSAGRCTAPSRPAERPGSHQQAGGDGLGVGRVVLQVGQNRDARVIMWTVPRGWPRPWACAVAGRSAGPVPPVPPPRDPRPASGARRTSRASVSIVASAVIPTTPAFHQLVARGPTITIPSSPP